MGHANEWAKKLDEYFGIEEKLNSDAVLFMLSDGGSYNTE